MALDHDSDSGSSYSSDYPTSSDSETLAYSELHSKLYKFWKCGRHCDVTIRIQEKLFKSHRLVLVLVSEYFDSLFGGTFESVPDEEITLPNVDATTFEEILEYAYTGFVPKFTVNNVTSLLNASEFLGLSDIVRHCNKCIDPNSPSSPFPDYYSSFKSNLNSFWNDGKYCDVTICLEEKNFRCHRLILATVSEYFDSLFASAFKERSSKKITLLDLDATAFGGILKFSYTDELPIVNIDNVFELLHCSDFLGVRDIKRYCVRYIRKHKSAMSLEHIAPMLKFALAINNNMLRRSLSEYVAKKFCVLVQKDEFCELQFDELNVLFEEYTKPLSHFRTLRLRDENVLLDALLRWVNFSREERTKYFEELFRYIKFEKVSQEYVMYLTNEYKIECSDKSLLKKFLIDHFSASEQSRKHDSHSISYANFLSSKNELTLYAYVTFTGGWISETKVFSFNKHKPEWRILPLCYKKEKSIHKMRSVVLDEPNNHLFAYSSHKFRVYDSVDLASTPSALATPPCKSNIFDMCGKGSETIYWYNRNIHNFSTYEDIPDSTDETRRGLYHYNCQLDAWFPLPELKEKVANACIIADDNLVYLIGGKNSNDQVVNGLAQAYDSRSQAWLQLPKTNNLYYNGTCCTLNGRIYVSNGEVVETYDSNAGKWDIVSCKYSVSDTVEKPPLKKRRKERSNPKKRMISYENLLWIFSSNGSKYYTNIIDPYEPETDKRWITNPLLEWGIRESLEEYKEEDEDDDSSASSHEGYGCGRVGGYEQADFIDAVVFKPITV